MLSGVTVPFEVYDLIMKVYACLRTHGKKNPQYIRISSIKPSGVSL